VNLVGRDLQIARFMRGSHLFALKREVASLRAVLADHGLVFVGLKEGLNVLIILIL